MDAEHEYQRLLRERIELCGDFRRAEENNLPGAHLLELRHRANKAWQVAEACRKRTGCSSHPTP